MTQLPCTKQLSGLRGTAIRTSLSSILQLLAQPIQGVVIHLATGGSRGAAATLSQRLSSQASAHHSSSTRGGNQCRTGPRNNKKTSMSGNFLVSATSVATQGTKHQYVDQDLEK